MRGLNFCNEVECEWVVATLHSCPLDLVLSVLSESQASQACHSVLQDCSCFLGKVPPFRTGEGSHVCWGGGEFFVRNSACSWGRLIHKMPPCDRRCCFLKLLRFRPVPDLSILDASCPPWDCGIRSQNSQTRPRCWKDKSWR